LIYDVNGQLVFEDNVQYIAPQDSPNLIFCDQNAAKSWNCVEDACVELSNNTGDFSSISECQEFCGTSSILKNNIELRIYPNPSSGLFKIQFDAINGEVNIYMTNMLGKEVYKTSVNSNEKNNEIIDLGDISKGIYMLKITNNRQSISEKIIIQ
jgi:hypothetical protein